jgi:hypothetical protein
LSKRPRAQKLSAEEAERLLAGAVSPDEALSKLLQVSKVGVLADGRAVVVADERFVLADDRFHAYPSIDELRTYAENFYSSTPPSEYLANHLPSGEAFLQNFDVVVSRLAGLLDLDARRLDGSLESVTLLDSAIVGDLDRAFEPEVYECLVGYLGEVLRRSVDGDWTSRAVGRQTMREPQIADAYGRTYSPVGIINELMNCAERYSLREGIDLELS